jgi:acetolactate synthase-1/2/3 large subunit
VKVADAVAQFLEQHVKHVFCISGGASLHLIHAIARTKVRYICPQHEQAAGFAADAYSRIHGIGVSIVTSGPGATNLVTAIAASYYDSVAVLYLTGQVLTSRMTGTSGCRQIGFQETPIVEMVKPITKYAVTVMDKHQVIGELERAVSIARAGRPGPVLVDIPDDLQRAEL